MPCEISVIIPAYNEENNIHYVLDSLLTLRRRTQAEVIVVDAGSTDRTSEVASTFDCLVVRSGPAAPGAARNIGVRAASSEVIAFLDGDVIVTADWTNRILDILRNPSVLSNTLTGAFYGISPDATWIERIWFGNRASDTSSYINGGNLLIRRGDLLSIGGFDERLPTGEDYELCQRARRAGLQVMIDDDLRTIHLGYPRTAKEFLIREAWHGTGDFTSLSSVFRSKVALATIAFLAFLSFVPVGILFGSALLSLMGFGGAVLLCCIASLVRWKHIGLRQVWVATPIFFLYFSGRALAMFLPVSWLRQWRSRS